MANIFVIGGSLLWEGETAKQRKVAIHQRDNEKPSSKKPPTNRGNLHPILQLQQTIGNRAVTNMLQRKNEGFDNGTIDEYSFETHRMGKPVIMQGTVLKELLDKG